MRADDRMAQLWLRFAVAGTSVVAGDLALFSWSLTVHRYAIAVLIAANAAVMGWLTAGALRRHADLVGGWVDDPRRPWWLP